MLLVALSKLDITSAGTKLIFLVDAHCSFLPGQGRNLILPTTEAHILEVFSAYGDMERIKNRS